MVLATPAWSLNGPNVFMANLVRGLREQGSDARIVVTRPDWRDDKPMPAPDDVELEVLPLPGRFVSLAKRWEAMRSYLLRLAPCVYVPNHDIAHSCIAPALPPEVKICGILHSDDAAHYEHAERLGEYWDSIAAVSPEIQAEAAKRFPGLASRLHYVPYGVAVPDRVPPRQPADALRLIYAGRLDQTQKRVFDLPRIVRAALDLGAEIELTIAGAGAREQALRSACAGLPIRFVGTLPHREILQQFASHDVFLLPSAFEGLPLSLLEAIAHGCVPVVSDVRSGVAHAVRDGANGFRVPVGRIGQFAERIRDLYENRATLSEFGHEAHMTAKSEFRAERMVERYGRLFDGLFASGFERPRGPVAMPPDLPRAERLPGWIQMAGHYTKRWVLGSNR